MTLDEYKTIAEIVESVLTALAILVGGFWTYFLFIKNRISYPAVDIEVSYEKYELTEGKTLIHTAVKIDNKGSILLNSDEAELRLRQVIPAPEEVIQSVSQGYDPVSAEEQEIEWPMVVGRKWVWDDNGLEIEPGESDVLHADFCLESDVQVIEFYF